MDESAHKSFISAALFTAILRSCPAGQTRFPPPAGGAKVERWAPINIGARGLSTASAQGEFRHLHRKRACRDAESALGIDVITAFAQILNHARHTSSLTKHISGLSFPCILGSS